MSESPKVQTIAAPDVQFAVNLSERLLPVESVLETAPSGRLAEMRDYVWAKRPSTQFQVIRSTGRHVNAADSLWCNSFEFEPTGFQVVSTRRRLVLGLNRFAVYRDTGDMREIVAHALDQTPEASRQLDKLELEAGLLAPDPHDWGDFISILHGGIKHKRRMERFGAIPVIGNLIDYRF